MVVYSFVGVTMALKVLLLAALVAGTLAVPISIERKTKDEIQDPRELSHCLHAKCPITDFPKQGFRPRHTYVYSYESTSLVQLNRIPLNASSSLQLKAEVLLSWVSPCQAVLAIKNPIVNGHTGDRITTELLTTHPMVITMKEGLVTSVCAHPHDHSTGLNIKKGIISTMQNGLPSFNSIVADKTYYETDVLGRCPTQYEIKYEKSEHIVKKFKDHKQCRQQQPWEKESPVTAWWLQTPLPLKYSNSTCHQTWDNEKILKKVVCTDRNVLKPLLGSVKTVRAMQWSTLEMKSVEATLREEPFQMGRKTNLTFELINEPKSQEIVEEVERLLKELCSKTETSIAEEAAPIVAKLIGFLHRVPEQKIKEILQEIKEGRYCQNVHLMESIYKDILMFVNNGGAIEVMVEDVLSGQETGGRTPLYSIAIHTNKRPCIHAVQAVSRLFDAPNAPQSMVLAAGTLVSKFCSHHPRCMNEPSVREIMEKLSRRLESSCASTKRSEEQKREVLTALKAIGNMMNITTSLERSIMKCVESSEADIMVRVAAAQSFRQVCCTRQPTSDLVKIVVTPHMQTEVRIASYISAMRCAGYEEVERILNRISSEPNTQVRSFILSNLRNIQTSDDQSLRGLRYKISSLIIPNDYRLGYGPHSRQVDLSYYAPSIGLGESVTANIIYAPGSYIPRQFQANFSANIFDNIINLGEFSIRVQDIEKLLEMAFGPNGYFRNKTGHKILEDITMMIRNKGKKIKEQFEMSMSARNREPGKHHEYSNPEESSYMETLNGKKRHHEKNQQKWEEYGDMDTLYSLPKYERHDRHNAPKEYDEFEGTHRRHEQKYSDMDNLDVFARKDKEHEHERRHRSDEKYSDMENPDVLARRHKKEHERHNSREEYGDLENLDVLARRGKENERRHKNHEQYNDMENPDVLARRNKKEHERHNSREEYGDMENLDVLARRRKEHERKHKNHEQYSDMENPDDVLARRNKKEHERHNSREEYGDLENLDVLARRGEENERRHKNHEQYNDMENPDVLARRNKKEHERHNSREEYGDMENLDVFARRGKENERRHKSHEQYSDMENPDVLARRNKKEHERHNSREEYGDMENLDVFARRGKENERRHKSHEQYSDMENPDVLARRHEKGHERHNSREEYGDLDNLDVLARRGKEHEPRHKSHEQYSDMENPEVLARRHEKGHERNNSKEEYGDLDNLDVLARRNKEHSRHKNEEQYDADIGSYGWKKEMEHEHNRNHEKYERKNRDAHKRHNSQELEDDRWGSVSDILSSIQSREGQSEGKPRIDSFIRLFGQEIAFTSLMGDIHRLNNEELLEKLVSIATRILLKVSQFNVHTARVFQTNSENFIVTQQGIPLQVKLVTTAVAGIKATGGISLEKSSAKVSTQISAEVNGFVGYTLGAKAGLRTRATLLTHTPIEIDVEKSQEQIAMKIDIPETQPSIKMEMNTYAVFKMPSKQDEILKPSKGSYPSAERKGCSSRLPALIGLKLCYEVEMPKYERENMFPLGHSKILITANKAEQKELLRITGTFKKEQSSRKINLEVETPCAQQTKMGEIELEHKSSLELKSLKLYLQAFSIRRSLRVDMEPKTSRSGRKLEMVIYSGRQKEISSADKVLMAAIGGRAEEEELTGEFELKTMNHLEQYLKANIELDASVHLHKEYKFIPKKVDLRKCEIDVAVPGLFRTSNFIRQEGSSSNALQYRMQSITEGPSSELLRVTGMSKVEGSISRDDLDCLVDLEVKTERMRYKYDAKLISNRHKKQAMVKVYCQESQKNIFLFDVLAEKPSASSQDWITKAEFEMPRHMKSYRLDGSIREQSSNSYRVDIKAKKEQEPLFELEGPITYIKSQEALKEQSDLVLKDLRRSREFQIKTKFHFANGQKTAIVDLKESGKEMFAIEAEMSRRSREEMISSIGVHIPEVIEAKLKVDKSSNHVQMLLNGFLRPNTPESKKLKGSGSINLQQKEVKAKVTYETEKGSEKEAVIETNYDYNFERKYASVKGSLSLNREEYTYTAETILGFLTGGRSDRNDMKIHVAKRSGQVLLLVESSCQIQGKGQAHEEVEYKGKLEMASGKLYQINSRFTYDFKEAPRKLILNGKAEVSTPRLRDITIIIDADIDTKSRDQRLKYKMDVSGSGMRSPIKVDFDMTKSHCCVKSEVKISLTPIHTELEGKCQLTRNERRQIEDMTLEVTARLPNQKTYKLVTRKSAANNLEISVKAGDKKVLAWEQEREGQGAWTARLTVPSRVMEASSRLSSHKMALSVYPNKRHSEEKYEISGHYEGRKEGKHGSTLSAGATLIYPGRSKPFEVKTNMATSEESSQGTLELDIFREPSQKIYVHVKALKLDKESYKAVAELQMQSRSASPKLTAEVGLSSRVKVLKFFLEEGSSPKPILEGVLSFNKPSYNHAYLYCNLRTYSDSVEMVAALQGHTIYQCRGGSINGTIRFNEEKSYDFAAAVCAPGYLEVGVKKSHEREMYIAKVGMKNPSSIKVALDLVHNSTKAFNVTSVKKLENTLNLYGKHLYLPKESIVLFGAKLWAPMMVSVDAKCDMKKFEQYLDEVVKPITRDLKKLSQQVFQRIPEELKEKLGPVTSLELVEELKHLKDEICESTRRLIEELKFDLPTVDEVKELVLRSFHKCLYYWDQMYNKLEKMFENIFGTTLRDVKESLHVVDKTFKRALQYLHEEYKLVTSEGREALMKCRLYQWIVRKLETSSIWNWMMEMWDEFLRNFEEDWFKIREFFFEYFEQLKRDLKEFLDTLADFGICRRFIKWLESWMFDHNDNSDTPLLVSMIKKFYSLYIDQNVGFARVQIPLRRPVSSLTAAVRSIGVPLPEWYCHSRRYSSTYYRKPEPTYNMIVEPHKAWAKLSEDKIITFDGIVIPVIPCPCEIQMAQAEGVEVSFKKLSKTNAEVVIQSDKGEKIKVEFEEGKAPLVDGRRMTEKEMKKPGLTLTRLSETAVKVDTKSMIIIVSDRDIEIETKRSAYNKISGLMGTHDNEKATDFESGSEVHYKPSSREGKHHLSPKSARKMMESYRKDSSCSIPEYSQHI